MPDFDLDAWLEGDYELAVEEARIGVPPTLRTEHERLDAELRDAMLRDSDRARELAGRLADLEAEMAAKAKAFTFQALTDVAWADLMADHPPTDEQLVKHPQLDHNPDTFPPAAVAASSLEPKLTEAQARKLRGGNGKALGRPDWAALWNAVLAVNREVMPVPKSPLAGVVLQASNASPGTPARKASRGRSSSDGNGAPSPATTTPKGP